MIIELRTHVTPLYAGSFLPESGRTVQVDTPATLEQIIDAVGDDTQWFAVEVREAWWQKWTADEGEVEWRPAAKGVGGAPATRRVYVGERLTVDDVRSLGDGYGTLIANMEGNRWEEVVRTRLGNFQPIESGDVVLDPADPRLPHEHAGSDT